MSNRFNSRISNTVAQHDATCIATTAPATGPSRSLVAAALAGLMLVFDASVVAAQPLQPNSQAELTFAGAIDDYVAMHRRLEKLVGPITLDSSIESINRSIQGLAAAIREERADARQGELFTPAIARQLRVRVHEALRAHGFAAADVIDSQRFESIDPLNVHLHVNDTFPWVLSSAMFPCVLDALPPLPSELQYRIVGFDLVLVDVHASLIVDILPNVVSDMTVRNLHIERGVR